MRFLNILKVVAAVVLAPQFLTQGASYQLAWNSNPEPDIAYYRLHIGTSSGRYLTVVPVGKVTSHVATNLVAGRTYFFALSAVNTSNIESDRSAEVSTAVSGNLSLSIAQVPGEIRISVQGTPGQTYNIQPADTLPQWGGGTTRTADASGRIVVSEPITSQGSRRFFRVVRQ